MPRVRTYVPSVVSYLSDNDNDLLLWGGVDFSPAITTKRFLLVPAPRFQFNSNRRIRAGPAKRRAISENYHVPVGARNVITRFPAAVAVAYFAIIIPRYAATRARNSFLINTKRANNVIII